MTNLVATIRDLFRATPYSGLEYRRKAGILRGASIRLVRNHAFSYDVIGSGEKSLGRRYIFAAAQNFALANVPLGGPGAPKLAAPSDTPPPDKQEVPRANKLYGQMILSWMKWSFAIAIGGFIVTLVTAPKIF